MKKLIFLLFIIAPIANAATIYSLPNEEGFFAKIWRCTWHISCYQQKLGATLTNITSSTLIKDYPAIQNTNNSNINAELLGVLTPARVTATSTTASSTFRFGLEVHEGSIAVGTSASTTIRTSATSSFNGGISTTGTLDAQSTTATSTFSNGIQLSSGCFRYSNGTCAITSGVTAGSASADQITYFTAATQIAGDSDFTRDDGGYIATNGTTTNATSSRLYVSDNARIQSLGIGVSTSTSNNVQIAGDLQVTGTSTITGGCNGCGIVPVYFSTGPTNYIPAAADGYIGLASSTHTSQIAHIRSPVSGIMRNLYVVCSATGAGGTFKFKIQLNGSASVIDTGNVVCTSGTEGSDTTNQIAIAKGDDLEIFADFQSDGQLLQFQGSVVITAAKF